MPSLPLTLAVQLQTIDWVILVASVAICFVPALYYAKKSGESVSEFFTSGQSVPWWLIGQGHHSRAQEVHSSNPGTSFKFFCSFFILS